MLKRVSGTVCVLEDTLEDTLQWPNFCVSWVEFLGEAGEWAFEGILDVVFLLQYTSIFDIRVSLWERSTCFGPLVHVHNVYHNYSATFLRGLIFAVSSYLL